MPLWLLLFDLNVQLAHGWGWEASPLFAAGGDGAEMSGAGLKVGKRFRGEDDTVRAVLGAWIEEGQIVTGQVQVEYPFGM